jgi:molecular chaperone GrpE
MRSWPSITKHKKEVDGLTEELKKEETVQPEEEAVELEEEMEIQEEPLEEVQEIEDEKEDELKTTKKKLEEMNERYLRVQAEYANYRNRTEREKSELYQRAGESIVKNLLEVKDNFERALSSVTEEEKELSFYQGVEMVANQFSEILGENGLKEIEAMGSPFDPNHHQAVMQMADEEAEPNHVIQVLQKGYQYGEKVLRPSMVVVSKQEEEE